MLLQSVGRDASAGSRPRLDRAVALAAPVVPVVLGAAVAVSNKPAPLVLAAIAGITGLAVAVTFPRWALLGTLFLLVAYLPDVVGGSSHKLASAALPLLLFVAVIVRHVCGVERVRPPADLWWYAFFGVGLLITTATAGHRILSELSDFTGFALLAAVMFALLDSKLWLRRAMWAIVAGAAMLAVLTVVQQLTKSYGQTFHGLAVITPDQTGMRSGGPLSPDYLAQMLVASAALAGYLALRAGSRRERWTAIGSAAVMLVAVFYTQSRGAIVAVVVAMIAALLLRGLPLRHVVALAAVVVVGGMLVLPSALEHRISDLTTLTAGGATTDSSLRGRVAENVAAVDVFRNHPIIGVGPDNFELHYLAYAQQIGLDTRNEARGAHSLYLESLAELGILGSIPFFLLLGMGLRRAWQARTAAGGHLDRESRLLAEACFVAWLAFLVSAAALHLSYPRYLWIFLALAFSAGRLPERRSVS